ncbi:hypothetical protein GT037_007219 [Alternaria burnsii]|uniref:Uncharacterized protein n=1 Tax=Alternaria burnsii TaxID=1187904 RepID=A0A8H7EE85_9PLEO|nr:uncharacterized protein GT037_007219 [Alternaria burnsii]KAF7674459.1 hypothetical protein GT037_007219 [Alternaria burnsii]
MAGRGGTRKFSGCEKARLVCARPGDAKRGPARTTTENLQQARIVIMAKVPRVTAVNTKGCIALIKTSCTPRVPAKHYRDLARPSSPEESALRQTPD